MTIGNVLRVMDENDLFDVPEAKNDFEKYGYQGNYFFFVIKNYKKINEEEIVGYLIAKIDESRRAAVVRKFKLLSIIDTSEKYLYHNTACSNLYDYIKDIKSLEGERAIYQVSLYGK